VINDPEGDEPGYFGVSEAAAEAHDGDADDGTNVSTTDETEG
jgi:hypothetical protein